MPRVLSVEFTDSDVKAVVLSGDQRKPVVEFAGQRLLEQPVARDAEGAAARGEALRELLRPVKAKPRRAILVAPKQCATVRRVRLPTSDPDEIASMAQFEAEKLIPFNVENHVISFEVVAEDSVKGAEVLIAAVDEGVMDFWVQGMEAAGSVPQVAQVSSLSFAEAFTALASDDERLRPTALLSIGLHHTDLTFLRDGEVVTTASFGVGILSLWRELMGEDAPPTLEALKALRPEDMAPRPAADAPTGEDDAFEVVGSDEGPGTAPKEAWDAWTRKLLQNLQRTYEFAVREYKLPPTQKVLIAGEGSLVPGLVELLRGKMGAAVEVFDALSRAGSPNPAGICLGAAYGAAHRMLGEAAEEGINLLPDRLVLEGEQKERRAHLAMAGAMGFIFLASAFLVWDSGRQHLRTQFERYDVFNQEMEPLVADIANKRRQMDVITRHIGPDRAGVLAILEAISSYPAIGPTDQGGRITLSDFKYEMGRSVEISGLALENDDITDFIAFLDRLRLDGERVFRAPDAGQSSTTTLPRREQTIYTFRITAELASGGRS